MGKIYLLTSKNDLLIPVFCREGLAAENFPEAGDIYSADESFYIFLCSSYLTSEIILSHLARFFETILEMKNDMILKKSAPVATKALYSGA